MRFRTLSKLELEQQSISEGIEHLDLAEEPMRLPALMERHTSSVRSSLSRRPSDLSTAARHHASGKLAQSSSPETTAAGMPPADRLRGLHFPLSQRYKSLGWASLMPMKLEHTCLCACGWWCRFCHIKGLELPPCKPRMNCFCGMGAGRPATMGL